MSNTKVSDHNKPSEEQIKLVNEIKAAEKVLGELLNQQERNVLFKSELKEQLKQVQTAKERLKECSMWACRSIFKPVESY